MTRRFAARTPGAGLFGDWTTADAAYSWFAPFERTRPPQGGCVDWTRALESLARYLKDGNP